MPLIVAISAEARRDIDGAANWYLETAGEATALRFVAEVEQIVFRIASAPGAGSPLYAAALDFPGLRTRRLGRFPYLLFYQSDPDKIRLLRALHQSRDIPAVFQGSD